MIQITTMRKLLFIIFVLLNITLYAQVYPNLWYRSDSLIPLPQEDSIAWTDEYTVFTVIRNRDKDSTDCLWSISEGDTISHAVLTNAFYSSRTGLIHSHNLRDFSKWCVYAHHGGIRLDSTKCHALRLGEQIVYREDSSELVMDTLRARIELEELAYFKGNVSKLISESFQTYLALKYGITLDYAPYMSFDGDTLWHPKKDEDYYHRVVGVGNYTVYGWSTILSQSKEDAVFAIQTDSLQAGEYILMGDDNSSMEWRLDVDGHSSVQRMWRLRQNIKSQRPLSLIMQRNTLDAFAEPLWISIVDENGNELQNIQPDSIVRDSVCYFTINRTDTLIHFKLSGFVVDAALQKQNTPGMSQRESTSDNNNIYFNIDNRTVVVNGFPDGQQFVLYLYDHLGKYLSKLTSTSPIDVSMLPTSVFYIEIMTDNRIVGSIPIPAL